MGRYSGKLQFYFFSQSVFNETYISIIISNMSANYHTALLIDDFFAPFSYCFDV